MTPEDTATTTETAPDPVQFSFLLSGEPQKKLDLDQVPSDDELASEGDEPKKEEPKLSDEEIAEEEWRSSHSIGSIPPKPKKDEGEPGDEEQAAKKPPQEKPAEAGKKKKVKFRNPFEDTKAKEPEVREQEQLPAVSEEQPPANTAHPEDGPYSITQEEYSNIVERLPQEARESVEFWLDAEEADPRYKGFAKKQINYIRSLSQKVKQLREEDPDTPLDENPKYRAWVKQNKPAVPAKEIDRLKKEIVINEAKRRVKEETSKEVEDLRQWKDQQEREKEIQKKLPALQQKSGTFAKVLIEELTKVPEAEEPMTLFNQKLAELKDPVKAAEAMAEEYPEEANIITRNHAQSKAIADEFLKVRMGIVKPDPETNRLHSLIAERVIAQEDAMMSPEMKSRRIRDGKMFTPAYQYRQMNPEERARHWTFNDEEVLNFLSAEAIHRTRRELSDNKKRINLLIQKYGNRKAANRADQQERKQQAANRPRHVGTDSPSSTPRTASNQETPQKSRLLHWDF